MRGLLRTSRKANRCSGPGRQNAAGKKGNAAPWRCRNKSRTNHITVRGAGRFAECTGRFAGFHASRRGHMLCLCTSIQKVLQPAIGFAEEPCRGPERGARIKRLAHDHWPYGPRKLVGKAFCVSLPLPSLYSSPAEKGGVGPILART